MHMRLIWNKTIPHYNIFQTFSLFRIPSGFCCNSNRNLSNGKAHNLVKEDRTYIKQSATMNLEYIVKTLQELAPVSYAEDWDNVGLLVEPSSPHLVRKVMLTNDLTSPVLCEAVDKHVDMIISYHPPIFKPVKRLCQSIWKEKIIVKCIESKIAVYSPHTIYDNISGGVNDWLIGAFRVKNVHPVVKSIMANTFTQKITLTATTDTVEKISHSLQELSCQLRIETFDSRTRLNIFCDCKQLYHVVSSLVDCGFDTKTLEIKQLEKPPNIGIGAGRQGELITPLSLTAAVDKVKQHLGLSHIRLAKRYGTASEKSTVTTVAVCAGSGSSVLRDVPVDLYVTGEMSHHDVLHAVSCGTSVILCEHSNTERGYLTVLQQKLSQAFSNNVEFIIAKTDEDPLQIA